MSNPILKYLFTATYKDGSKYTQTLEDVSKTDPTRSCFFDVKQDEVKTFEINRWLNCYLVDLEDGHFEVNGRKFKMHDEELKDFKLIYFIKNRVHINVTSNKLGQILHSEEAGHERVWRIGWKAKDKDGKNVERVMEIN